MRIVHAASLMVMAMAFLLIAGCSGGGGGVTPPDNSVGVVTVDPIGKTSSYTPPTSKQVDGVYATFSPVSQASVKGRTITSTAYYYLTQTGVWSLDMADTSSQFVTSAIGTFNMQVKAHFVGDTADTAIGSPIEVTLHVYGNGPPPPPDYSSAAAAH